MAVVRTAEILASIHAGQEAVSRQKNKELQDLVDSNVSILALHLRNSSAVVSEEQAGAVKRLHERVSTG